MRRLIADRQKLKEGIPPFLSKRVRNLLIPRELSFVVGANECGRA